MNHVHTEGGSPTIDHRGDLWLRTAGGVLILVYGELVRRVPFLSMNPMSSWVLGYSFTVEQLLRIAYEKGLAEPGFANMDTAYGRALDYIKKESGVSDKHAWPTLCWTEDGCVGTVWALSGRQNVTSSKQLRTKRSDIPEPEALKRLADFLDEDDIPRWYLREECWEREEHGRWIPGLSKKDVQRMCKRGTVIMAYACAPLIISFHVDDADRMARAARRAQRRAVDDGQSGMESNEAGTSRVEALRKPQLQV